MGDLENLTRFASSDHDHASPSVPAFLVPFFFVAAPRTFMNGMECMLGNSSITAVQSQMSLLTFKSHINKQTHTNQL